MLIKCLMKKLCEKIIYVLVKTAKALKIEE
jgi:hypothetical protein